MIVNQSSGTSIDEIEEGIYRISTPVPPELVPGGFSFNQYLVVDDEPLIFHTGGRRIFPLVKEAIETVLPATELRYVAFSHVESDECGSLNDFLAAAPHAVPVCSQLAAMISIEDLADRAPRPLSHGETLNTGTRTLRWIDTPHLPHGWEAGYLYDESSGVLFCGDIFTQGGADNPALAKADILEPSEGFRLGFMEGTGMADYFAHGPNTAEMIERLASTKPKTLACMHGSTWKGDGESLLLELRDRLTQSN